MIVDKIEIDEEEKLEEDDGDDDSYIKKPIKNESKKKIQKVNNII